MQSHRISLVWGALALPRSISLLSWRPLRNIEKSGLDVDSSAWSAIGVLEPWVAKMTDILVANAAVDVHTIDTSHHSTTSNLI